MTRLIRRHLVGKDQEWTFESPPPGWKPPRIKRTSLYLHVPFCYHFCPYCPYTKVPYDEKLIEPYIKAAIAEVDWWAEAIGPAEITSIYIGGGTPTLVMSGVTEILTHICKRFNVTGNICIETNPVDVNDKIVQSMHEANVSLVSLGVQSFDADLLNTIGRRYEPIIAEQSLKLLVKSGFSSVNADLMFALPGQTTASLIADLQRAASLGADQITTYPLFTFPYTAVGKFMQLNSVKMPKIRVRRAQYYAIYDWCMEHDFERVSVWGFKHGRSPRYSSVTRDGYIGIGPGAGSHLPQDFVLNTFDLVSWTQATTGGNTAVALRMPLTKETSGWWWLYWRLYDTRIPLNQLDAVLYRDAPKARRWLRVLERRGLAVRQDNFLELTESGSFWVHLLQNYFALNYVNTLWTTAQGESWPGMISI